MEPAFLIAAFGAGFLAHLARLPPLVGYLVAGFVLHALDYEMNDGLQLIADLGVLLLLFAIGLKLKLSTLARPVVWAGASLHMAVTTALVGALFLGLGTLGLPLASELDVKSAALIGFAFSFSSTVFAVKALEERNEGSSLQARLAIGILVVQDIYAVVFLTLAVEDPPSWWAIPVVIAVVGAAPLYGWVLDRSGRGELQLLLGLTLAVAVGAELFSEVGLKPDLGALLVGFRLANHPRAGELADSLLGLKDLLLIGFFLSIGLDGAPDGPSIIAAAIVLLVVGVKAAGFLWLISRFRFRVRTAWHTSATLATFSEFGLIVAVLGEERGMIDGRWVSAIAVAVATSFVLAAPLNTFRFHLYRRSTRWLEPLERQPIVPDDALIEPGGAQVLVFGMGRVGTGAYDRLAAGDGGVEVLGVDRRDDTVQAACADGRRVVRGDALDTEFWARLRLHSEIQVIILAMSDHEANLEAVWQVRSYLPEVTIVATALFPDQAAELEEAGVQLARNLYAEAGQGLADDAVRILGEEPG